MSCRIKQVVWRGWQQNWAEPIGFAGFVTFVSRQKVKKEI
jgi:hypothetical protein